MKRVMYAAVVALGCTVAASAQGGMGTDQMSKDKMSKDKMSKDAEKSVMVSGCVAESGGKYMLNNAMMMDHAGTGAGMAGGTMPAGGSPMASGAPMSYMLTGGSLKPHVGHKVEVTGMMKPMAGDAMGKENLGKDTMSKDNMGKGTMPKDNLGKDTMAKDDMMKKDMMGMGGTVAVKNVKMIAATCS